MSYLVLVQVETAPKCVSFVDAAHRHQRGICPLTYTDIISPTSVENGSSIVDNSDSKDKAGNRHRSGRGFFKRCLPIRKGERTGIFS